MNRQYMRAGMLAGTTSAILLGGALAFQYLAGLLPCEMCVWQRWPHAVAMAAGLGGALLLALGVLPARTARILGLAAIAALAVSGAIGVFHAGVEWQFWPGPTACTGQGYVPGSDIGAATFKVVRCDVAQWRLFGLSLAGYNAILSLGFAGICLALLKRNA